jgi:prepilin-type N-terminal cleavage/methylation domain-containing protein
MSASAQPRERGFTRIELLVVIAILLILSGLSGLDAPIMFCLGWVTFLWRVLPQLRPAPDQVAIFVVGVLAVTVLTHLLLRRVVTSGTWSVWNSVRLVGLVFLVFVAGTALVGLTHQSAWLLTSKEPWMQRSFASMNHLKQLGLAVHNAASTDDQQHPLLPPGLLLSPQGEPLHGWPTLILPYIEEEALFREIDRTRPWNDPANAARMKKRIPTYQHPGRADEKADGWPVIHYAANAHVMGGDQRRRLEDFVAQGTSNVLLAGEVTGQFNPWAAPVQWRDPALGLGHPAGFGSPVGRTRVIVVLLDGSVRSFDVDKDDAAFRALGGGGSR